ncbi:MAG: twin-arginine translocase subunit TatC [Verrucomicrobiaceae bacterium]|nr:twin-arginine translocase subunit TatC [Verrucomicrobiaceae bacterium]
MFQRVIKVRERVAVDLGETDTEKPFLDHLEDLRVMVTRMAITLCVAVLGTFFFSKELIEIVKHPIIAAGLKDKITLIGINITDAFMVQVNVSMMAGIIISFPLLLLFLLQFVLPGLKTTEKKVLFPAIAIGFGLFLAGVMFAFFVVSPGTIFFFYSCNIDINNGVVVDKLPMSVITYVKFVTQFVLIFGACFETPVLVMALVKLDILSYKVMKTTRTYAVIAIAVLAAVVTPTQDALTLGLLAVPMYVLYEICIWLAWWMEKKDRAANPEYYKGIDADEKAMEAEGGAEWDNADYNPWSTSSEDEEDQEELTPQKPVAPTVPMTPISTPAPETPPTSEEGDKDKDKPKPVDEMTLEDYAREDEKRNHD